jgi:REP element-mobilizing transposase RayT
MTLFQDKFKTSSNRLQNWDYSNEAVYFITMTTEDRKCIFGSIVEDKMILNNVGQIVENELLKSIKIRKDWFFHNWIVMPNHSHLLIEIQNNDNIKPQIGDMHIPPTHIVEMHSSASTSGTTTKIENANKKIDPSQPTLSRKSNSISSFVAVFKSVTTKQINDLYREKQNIDKQIIHTDIVETHSSASTSGTSINIGSNIDTSNGINVVSNVAETHCCASLQIRDANKNVNKNTKQTVNESQSVLSNKKIWQTNYHDHIVRNHKRFEIIYNYIKENPRSWDTDSINLKFQ